MDKYYIGLAVSQRRLEVFASDQKVEEVLAESGYDFIAGQYGTLKEAKQAANDFASQMVNVTYLNRG